MRILHLVFFLCFCISSYAQDSIEGYLKKLPGVTFKKVEDSPYNMFTTFELEVTQFIDHKNPSVGTFTQKVYLNHAGFNNYTIMATEGYSMEVNRMYEPTIILGGNQVEVEHRYFGSSVPENKDWKYLTLEQATADLHHIRELLGTIYQKDWVSTGISKGGQTTIAYRYFYPNDVTVSMPYVAPLNNSIEDKRIYKFLKKVGSKKCRKAITNFQKKLLKNKKKVIPLLKWYAKGANMEFNYHSLEQAFELGVLEYPFSFWQYGTPCSALPDKDASLETMVEHFIDVVGISFYSDKDVAYYAPHYYQASTQLGYYGFETKKFKKHIKTLPKNPNASFAPDKMDLKYNPTYNDNVAKWLAKKGERFIYIYGGIDTWSATMVPQSSKVDALWFILEGKHHSNANIANMSEQQRKKVNDTLKRWLGF